MKIFLSCLGRIFRRRDSKISVQQQVLIQQTEEVASSVTEVRLSSLEQDMERYRSEDLTEIDRSRLNRELNSRYAKQALEHLMKELQCQAPAATKQDALQNIDNACQLINGRFPLKWQLPRQGALEFGATTRFSLTAHYLWINPNGAYCIEDWRHSAVIFCKTAADGSAFEKPQSFTGNRT